MGGKNEDARVVLFTEEDRIKAFSECHASKSGGHQGRDRTEDKLRHYYWSHVHLDIRHWVSACMHTYTCTINTHTHITHTVYTYTVHVHALLVVCVIYVPRQGRIQDFVLGGAYRDGNGGVPLQTCQGVWESAVSTAPKP